MKQVIYIVISGFLSERLIGSFTLEASGYYHLGRQDNVPTPQEMSIA